MQESLPYIDVNDVQNRVRGNMALYARMLKLFLNGQEFILLKEAYDAGDMRRAASIVHAIKGMTGNLSLMRLYEACTELYKPLKIALEQELVMDDVLRARFVDFFSVHEETATHVRAYLAALEQNTQA